MAQEVIDLVSSTPPRGHPLSPPAGGGQRQSASTRAACSTHEAELNIVDFAGLSDDFDVTGDIDSLIEAPTQRPLAETCREKENRALRASKTVADADVLGLDEFDDDSICELGFTTSAGAKRRRISISPGIQMHNEPSNRANSKGKFSPVGGSSSFQSRTPTTKQATDLLPSSDPFATSPPQPTKHSSAGEKSADVSSLNLLKPSLPTKLRKKGRLASTTPIPAPPSSDPLADSPTSNAKRGGPNRGYLPEIESSSPQVITAGSCNGRSLQTWDPISSSAPETATTTGMDTGTDKLRSNARCSNVIEIDSDSAGGSDDDLPDIQNLAWMPRRTRSPLGRSRSDIFPSRERAKAPSSSTMTARPNNGKRTRRTAIERETEKETKRHERQAVKEAKLREKERAAALVEVNKMRTDKKVSTPEMIVDLPSTLDVSIRTHVETLLEALSVEHSTWDSPHNAIKWRRKVTSRFNKDAGHWEPIPRRIMGERHAAVIVPAAEFVRMAIDGRVGAHATQVQEAFPDHQIIYLLEGLASWTRKNRNLRNRQFTSGVRAREEQQKQQQQQTGGNWRRRNGTASTEAAVVVPDYVVEDALLELQVMHDVLIHHTAMALETAQWLAVLTQHISTIPYRKQRDRAMYGAAFCMESGQVKTGDDASSTYICMLQEIARVTAPIAHGIAVEFGSVTDLVRGLETGGPGRLEGVRKTINNEGQLSDRTIGQAVSRRMYKVFTGRDETSTDI